MAKQLGPHPNNAQVQQRLNYGVVRDGITGKVKVDDPKRTAPEVFMAMTRAERAEAGMWDGDYVRDAQGVKRIRHVEGNKYVAIDDIRASSIISVDGVSTLVNERADIAADTEFFFKAGGQ